MGDNILGYALPGSRAELLLLNKRYRKMTDEYAELYFKKGSQMIFNLKFLMEEREKNPELRCEFCNKKVSIFYWWDKHTPKDKSIMATVDHFIPKSLKPGRLSKNKDNLLICCDSCNNKKDNKIYPIETIKFPRNGEVSDGLIKLYNEFKDK